MKTYLGIVLFGLAATACSGSNGDSGVDKNKKVNSLSSSEVQTFCKWALAEEGGAGHATMCPDGLTHTVQTETECESNYGDFTATCTATVSDAESCVHALAADLCSFGGDACLPLITCTPPITPARVPTLDRGHTPG